MHAILQERAQVLHDTRAFFYRNKVMEVETPALSQFATTDPYIESFAVMRNESVRYLHTSAEYPMKRLLVSGSGDIYQICKVWRADELGGHHSPEFTMLEWYRVGFSYHQLMHEVDQLLLMLVPHINKPSQFLTYQQAFQQVLSFDPHTADYSTLVKILESQPIDMVSTFTLDSSGILDVLMTHCVEPTFSQNCFTFIYDYPASQKALSCLSADKLAVAQRFEVYLGSVELGNGYQEETESEKNYQQLQSDLNNRLEQGRVAVPMDTHFLSALERGMPESSGVAIGIDRVLMCRTKKNTLEDIIALPWAMA